MLTLPHTGLHVPHDRLRIRALHQLDLPAGVAVTATLLHDGRRVGQVANTGDGGATLYHPDPGSRFTRDDLRSFAARCRTPGDRVPLDEHVLDLLIEEHQTMTDLAAAERHGHTLARHVHPVLDHKSGQDTSHEIFACEYRELARDAPRQFAARDGRLAADLNRVSPCASPDGSWQI